VKQKQQKLIFNEDALRQFAVRFKKVRKEKGYSQEKLVYKADITLSQIARIETVRTNPTLISFTLEISPDEVFKEILL